MQTLACPGFGFAGRSSILSWVIWPGWPSPLTLQMERAQRTLPEKLHGSAITTWNSKQLESITLEPADRVVHRNRRSSTPATKDSIRCPAPRPSSSNLSNTSRYVRSEDANPGRCCGYACCCASENHTGAPERLPGPAWSMNPHRRPPWRKLGARVINPPRRVYPDWLMHQVPPRRLRLHWPQTSEPTPEPARGEREYRG